MHFLNWLRDVVTSAGFQWSGFIIGLVGTAIAIYALIDSRRKDRIRNYLFEVAEKNLDKKITEEELRKRKEEVKLASDRIEALQKRIEKEIPLEAKRTVLKDRLDFSVRALKQQLDSTRALKQELEAIGEITEVPPDLLRSIEAEISPEYVVNAQRESLKTYLTIVMTSSAILSSALPYDLRRIIEFPLIALGAVILVVLVRLYIPKRWGRQHVRMLQVICIFLGLCSVIVLGFGSLISAAIWNERERTVATMGIIATLLVGGVLGWFGLRFWKKSKLLRQMQPDS